MPCYTSCQGAGVRRPSFIVAVSTLPLLLTCHQKQAQSETSSVHKLALKDMLTCVIPIKNKAALLRACLDSVRIAAREHARTHVILVDNGSTDGAKEIQKGYGEFAMIDSFATSIGQVRNDGALSAPEASAYVFLDSDCEVPSNFFAIMEQPLVDSELSAWGCEVVAPADGHWTETMSDAMHRAEGDGPRKFINSACFAIRREWFVRINGFDAELVSGEDVDICERLLNAGGSLWQFEAMKVIHLGNPKSLRRVYQRYRWHGEGAWKAGKGLNLSATAVLALLHGILAILGLVGGFILLSSSRHIEAATVALAGLSLAPCVYIAGRAIRQRRAFPVTRALIFVVVLLSARFHGLIKSFAKNQFRTKRHEL